MTFLDLLSGIGGFRLAREQAGHICVGHCEIDKYANQSYIAMHKPRECEWYADDITRVRAEDMPRADCWCFGFPCQDISIAGKQQGFAGQRSSLFFEDIQESIIVIAYYRLHGEWFCSEYESLPWKITHWMPLPSLPEE